MAVHQCMAAYVLPSLSDAVQAAVGSSPRCGKLGSSLAGRTRLGWAREDGAELRRGMFAIETPSARRSASRAVATLENPEMLKGKYSYDVENVINHLTSLAPRGSIARTMDVYRNKLTMQDFALIFREFAQRSDWQKALRLFKYMLRHQWCKPNEHVYTIMIGKPDFPLEKFLPHCHRVAPVSE
jgi:pentatricopeptide repeat protein